MSIDFRCEHCGQRLSVADERHGQAIRCPVCREETTAQRRPEAPLPGTPPPDPRESSRLTAAERGVESPNIFLPPERMSAPLASREARLAGAMIDAAVIVVGYLIGAVIAYFNGTMQSVDWAALKEDQSALFDPDRAEFWLLVHISLAALPLRIVQWLLIARRAQSLGKIIMRTRIVRFENGRDIGFLRGVGVRVWFKELLWGIPVVGPALMVFDPLLIFTAQRRCLHDYFASSLVVEAK